MHVLLENGANIQCKDANGWTPILAAAYGEHVYCVQLLLEHGSLLTANDIFRIEKLKGQHLGRESRTILNMLTRIWQTRLLKSVQMKNLENVDFVCTLTFRLFDFLCFWGFFVYV